MEISEFLALITKKEINRREYHTYGFQEKYKDMINIDNGYLNFFTNLNYDKKEIIIPTTNPNNRCGELRESTLYVVIHDTASGVETANAMSHSNWLMSMATNVNSTHSVSWHYTIDENGYINHLPLDAVGYHAGDGTSVKLEFTDTFIKASDSFKLEVSGDNYYVINGIKTNIKVPDYDNELKFPYLGINYKISSNNTYMLPTTYYNSTYKTICNKGGNLNSIGIETCVNKGSDYIRTMRICSDVVCDLLIKYNLNINDVKQHNSFSGKDCPMAIRHNGMWEEFINLVYVNYLSKTIFKDYKFKFESLDKEYLNNEGKVIKFENNHIVKYKICVNDKEYIFSSVMRG